MRLTKQVLVFGALAITFCGFGSAKKPKAALTPTQADIVKGCIAVRFITYHEPSFARMSGISFDILNDCDRELKVDLSLEFFARDGSSTAYVSVGKLVPGISHTKWDEPIDRRYVATGRIVNVIVTKLPAGVTR